MKRAVGAKEARRNARREGTAKNAGDERRHATFRMPKRRSMVRGFISWFLKMALDTLTSKPASWGLRCCVGGGSWLCDGLVVGCARGVARPLGRAGKQKKVPGGSGKLRNISGNC